ncbi:nuclear transport factor 2 family protein [Parafrankia sp. FMc2]|uniref:nuclear transport factor 2 family protein n=1 Tax=Parafrankia sp. FMc2 TaxID=3233196 RepID=UPI0034D6B8F7
MGPARVRTVPSVDVVRAFYDALNRRDVDGLTALVNGSFDEAAVLELPPSLPYGGRVAGVAKLRRMFAAMAGGQAVVGPRVVEVERIVGGDDSVVAVLAFDWGPPGGGDAIASGASELWSFRAGKVTSIRAYYWDTAALVASSTSPKPGR